MVRRLTHFKRHWTPSVWRKYFSLLFSVSALVAIGYVVTLRQGSVTGEAAMYRARGVQSDAASVPVLLYHGVVDKVDGYNTPEGVFRDQMLALYNAGYQTITLDQFNQYRQGNMSIPDKSFVLTFDDGRKDSFKPVDPILKELDYHAVMFVIAARVDDTDHGFYLTRDELVAMKQSGRWDIGAHAHNGHRMIATDAQGTQGHYYGNKQWQQDQNRLETDDEYTARVTTDLREAQQTITSMGVELNSFAFPFGDYGQESLNFRGARSIMIDASTKLFTLNFYQPWAQAPFGYNYPHDNGMVKRIEPGAEWSGEQLVAFLNMGHEKQLPQNLDTFGQSQNWRSEYGELSLRNGQLLTAARGGTGSAAVLDGTKSWQNYTFESEGTWTAGEALAVMARYSDSDNYLALSLSLNTVTLRQKLNGRHSVLAQVPVDGIKPGQDFHVTLQAHDGEITGLVNGAKVVTAQLSPGVLVRGGVGFRTDDPQADFSSATVTQLSVTQN